MKTRLLLVPSLLVMLAVLVAAGCGGGSQAVPADAVATVGSTPISKATFQGAMNYAIAINKAKGQPEPKVGTAAYSQFQDSVVNYLVSGEEFQQEAKKLGVTVTDKDFAKYLDSVKNSYYHGSEKQFEAALKKSGITLAGFKQYYALPLLLSQNLQTKVTSSANVSTSAAKQYYTQNKASYGTPAQTTRSVRHILVKNKKLADQIEQKLNSGASFASLAKKYSKDPGSAAQGGKYAAVQGREVPAYDATAFTLKTGKTSAPVDATSKANGSFGWFIIQALGPVKKTAAKMQPFSQVEAQIKLQLGQQKKQLAWTNWVATVQKDYKGKVAYQSGYKPATPTTPTVPAQTTTG